MSDIIRACRGAGISEDQISSAMEYLRFEKRKVAVGKTRADRVARYRRNRFSTETEWRKIRLQVLDRDGAQCGYCQDRNGPLEVDHVIPVSKGGKEDLSNLVVACRSCNASKGGLSLEEWRAKRGD